jgi:tetratricopeptide (TPR) repeat protein
MSGAQYVEQKAEQMRNLIFAAIFFGLSILPTVAQGGRAASDKRKATNALSVFSTITRLPTDEEEAILNEERLFDLKIYVQRAQDFQDVVDNTVRRLYEMKRDSINLTFDKVVESEWRVEEDATDRAIRYFQAFLKKYPNLPLYTPDAMYRLGELYYDRAYFDYQKQLEEYSKAEDAGQADGLEVPAKNFTKTIALYKDLILNFPRYPNVDGAYYILGYCLKESGDEEAARLAWLSLVCKNKFSFSTQDPAAKTQTGGESALQNPAATLDTGASTTPSSQEKFIDPFEGCEPVFPKSRFLFESWWLIGEYHFDYDSSRFGVETAIAAYKKLAENPDHKFYDKGLYKLAWSYFKADMYKEAVNAFAQVVDFSDKNPIEGGSMRPEAVQYLAVCFYTDDWNMNSLPDDETPTERVQNPSLMAQDKPWTKDVYERLGDIYSDNEKGREAIQLWKMIVEKWPLDLRAPFVQQKIAREYSKMQEPELEIEARSALEKYGPGGAWWNANKDHPVEQDEAASMARDALLEAAYHFHRQAQELRQRGLSLKNANILEQAIAKYNLAAATYRKFIEQNPDAPEMYEVNFNLAETLFWSGQYENAEVEYRSVRDSNLDDRFRIDAASMLVVSLEELVKKAQKSGEIVVKESAPEIAGEPPTPVRLSIPPVVFRLMAEREAFVKIAPYHENAGKYRYQTAQNYYRYGLWDDAKNRYESIYNDYCKTDPIGYVSWQTMMTMAAGVNDVDEQERLALMQKDKRCNAEGLAAITGENEVIDIDVVLGDVAMRRALDILKTCMAQKDPEVCSQAGDALTAAVANAPKHPDADKALHNAALAFEIGGRFDSAMKLYGRIIQEYPNSIYVGKCLFQQASAAANFFEYDRALENYRILADESRFTDYENRAAAIYNAAYILTNLQKYEQAVPYWKRYAEEEADIEKKLEADLNAAEMYFKAKKWQKAIDSFSAFLRTYDAEQKAVPYLVKAAHRIAESEGKLARHKNVPTARQKTVDLYQRSQNSGSISAEYAASDQFALIELDMRKFEKFVIRGTAAQIKEKIAEGAQQVKSLESRYREIAAYGRPEWSLAAEYRIGYAYEVFAKAMLSIPLPPLEASDEKMIKKLPKEDRDAVMAELEDKFRQEMEKQVSPMEDKAKAEYKIAVELAVKGNISNEWTLSALDRMNAYDPENYPRRHPGYVEVIPDTLAAPPFAAEVQ